MSIPQPALFGRTGQMHRLAVKVYIHSSGAIGDLPGTGKESALTFLLLRGASLSDVLGLEGQHRVPRNALAFAKVNEPYSNTSEAHYHETQSHMETLSLCTG
ncbi:MAG: hypothetical protein QGH60_14480 [Phycisphaerae bacterium]|jgi:hypothetical protein|nr:hypothetical protein [Phycisphaerae bacterium]